MLLDSNPASARPSKSAGLTLTQRVRLGGLTRCESAAAERECRRARARLSETRCESAAEQEAERERSRARARLSETRCESAVE